MAVTNKSSDGTDYEPLVLFTEEEDGTGKFTVSIDDDDYRFEVVTTAESVEIDYIETLTYRGVIRDASPRDEVYDTLTSSEEFQEFVKSQTAF